jgi:hypothetical protein
MTPVTELLDGAPDLFGPEPQPDPSWDDEQGDVVVVTPARLSIVPKRSLRERVEGIDLIIETIEKLEDDGELTDEARDELSKMLIEALAGTRAKVDNVSAALATWESLEAGAKREIERLDARRARFARMRENLELHVMAIMEASQLAKLEGNVATLARRKNPPSVAIADAAAVPAAYLRTPAPPKPAPDKTLIKSALQGGVEVPGCTLAQTWRLQRS